MLFFSREATSEIYGPRSILYHICFPTYYLPLLFSDLLFQKPKNTLLQFFVIYFISRFCEIYWSNLLQSNLSFTWEVLTTPLMRWVASICSFCAGTIYIMLLGSPTGSITLVSSMREIATIAVLHSPFLFRENWRGHKPSALASMCSLSRPSRCSRCPMTSSCTLGRSLG